MNTRKFEYLETIRETIEQGDFEELKDFVADIRDEVISDPDFEDLFQEVNSGKYQEVVTLIDDIIYKEMQAEFEDFQETEEDNVEKPGSNVSDFSLEFDFDENLKEEISFEPFDDEGYFEKSEDDNY